MYIYIYVSMCMLVYHTIYTLSIIVYSILYYVSMCMIVYYTIPYYIYGIYNSIWYTIYVCTLLTGTITC